MKIFEKLQTNVLEGDGGMSSSAIMDQGPMVTVYGSSVKSLFLQEQGWVELYQFTNRYHPAL